MSDENDITTDLQRFERELAAEFGADILRPPPAKSTRDPLRPVVQIGETHHMEKVERRRYVQALQSGKARDLIDPLPRVGETLHAVMDGSYHGWSLVTATAGLIAPRVIDELVIATLSYNRENAAELCSLIDAGAIRAVTFLCSHYFEQTSGPEFEALADSLRQRGQVVAVARTHAKVVAMRAGEDHYVIESSANLRSCHNVEQFAMSNSRELFDFHRAWIRQLAEEAGA